MGDGLVSIVLIGNVDPQTSAVRRALARHVFVHITDPSQYEVVDLFQPELVIVAGWRHLVPPDVLAVPRYGTVGFHSARLPEYPGRAPIPWTLVRGDKLVWNTMLYLDEGVDSGDVIAAECRPITPSDTPDTLYQWVAQSCVSLLDIYLPSLLDGTAPRTPQDPARRGPLTSKDGWNVYHELQRLGAGHG